MYATRKAKEDQWDIEADHNAFPKQREKWALAATTKRLNPEMNSAYPQYVCAQRCVVL